MAWNVNESYDIFIFISPIFLTTFSTHILIITFWLFLAIKKNTHLDCWDIGAQIYHHIIEKHAI
jgi:hypothetical protein